MATPDDLVQQVRSLQRALSTAQSDQAKDEALDALHRLGRGLSADDIKAVVACGCGPSGERGIESWPCVIA